MAGRFAAAAICIVIGDKISRDFELAFKVMQNNITCGSFSPVGSWHLVQMRVGLAADGLFSTLNIRQRKLRAKNADGSGVGQRSRSR